MPDYIGNIALNEMTRDVPEPVFTAEVQTKVELLSLDIARMLLASNAEVLFLSC